MKIKFKFKTHILFLAALSLIFAGALSLVFFQNVQSAKAYGGRYEYESRYSNDERSYNDLPEGRGEFEHDTEEEHLLPEEPIGIQPANVSVSNRYSCNTISGTHGAGRQNGYSANFLNTGCGSYCGISYTYGAMDIPFYIYRSTMSVDLVNDIRFQAAMWNQAVMHDGTGQVVNLYEVKHTKNINGLPVVKVRQESLAYNAGLFNASATEPVIKINTTPNVDTPVHEFGHLLGLADLDGVPGMLNGTHKTLMGYERGTRTETLTNSIKYQDIQGIAVMNNRHTVHQFGRYVVSGSQYIHFCFYCDMTDGRPSAMPDSAAMVMASSCVHNYKPMVSAVNTHWFKCTSCYKVIEQEVYATSPIGSTTTVSVALKPNDFSFTGKLTIPSSIGGKTVAAITNSGFANSKYNEFVIPDSVMTIGNNAFSGCNNLATIYIKRPSSQGVTSLGSGAFSGCPSFYIFVSDDSMLNYQEAAYWSAYANYISFDTPWLSFALNSSGAYAVSCRQGASGIIDIPETYRGKSVTEIADSGFANCTEITDVFIPKTVISIGNSAFAYCSSLTGVPTSSVRSIGDYAFQFCTGITNASIRGTVDIVGNYAFLGCGNLKTVYVGRSAIQPITSLAGFFVFWECPNLTKIYVPDSPSVTAYKTAAYWSLYANYITTSSSVWG